MAIQCQVSCICSWKKKEKKEKCSAVKCRFRWRCPHNSSIHQIQSALRWAVQQLADRKCLNCSMSFECVRSKSEGHLSMHQDHWSGSRLHLQQLIKSIWPRGRAFFKLSAPVAFAKLAFICWPYCTSDFSEPEGFKREPFLSVTSKCLQTERGQSQEWFNYLIRCIFE